jgi:hypothetical protein
VVLLRPVSGHDAAAGLVDDDLVGVVLDAEDIGDDLGHDLQLVLGADAAAQGDESALDPDVDVVRVDVGIFPQRLEDQALA